MNQIVRLVFGIECSRWYIRGWSTQTCFYHCWFI